MPHDTISSTSCTSVFPTASSFKRLAALPSRPSLAAMLANLSAASLVAASAGLGAVYAFQTGSEHGAILGALFVVMAVGLELAKPLAVTAAFTSFRSWAVVRGAALALLAMVAITYSLSAELSLMAGTRGDVVAHREAALKASTNTDAEVKRARDRYEMATKELATLPAARPTAELQAQIDGLLMTPGADGCTAINGKITQAICPQVAALKTEKARADRRAELGAIIATPLPVVAPTTAGEVKEQTPARRRSPSTSPRLASPSRPICSAVVGPRACPGP
ncbi:MAG: hypothetical protein WDN31_18800 [Hyphomicrobium sp.]